MASACLPNPMPWPTSDWPGRPFLRCSTAHRRFALRICAIRSDRKFTVGDDCGQIINPDGLVKCVEGNIVQGVSRALWEEVTFDRNAVTSIDWITYPILDITETPGEVNVVLINHPEIPPSGAGEPSIRPVAAAIANAIFDATGVRIRRVPFSPERVKAALS